MSDVRIVIASNGPYLVSGSVPLQVERIATDANGGSWSWESGRAFEPQEKMALCRCGASANKPFCDGSHVAGKFDGTEVAARGPYDALTQTIDGPKLRLDDIEPLCAFARFCDVGDRIWGIVPAATDDAAVALATHEATHCPSGRLVLRRTGEEAPIEPTHPPSIVLVEDPEKASSGPLWVRGGIDVTSMDGTPYETRNRVTLCRCGASANKPFCDGSHVDVGFRDGLD